MSRFLDIIEDYVFDPKIRKESNGLYEIEGITQTRNGINFIDNRFSAEITYTENLSVIPHKVLYKVNKLKQSNEGLIFKFSEDFNRITSDLEVSINEKFEVVNILNHQEIIQRWLRHKKTFLDKYQEIPKINELLVNYEKSISNEVKLRKSIFYEGIAYIFFPKIKHLILDSNDFPKRYKRKKNLNGYYFGIKIPILEDINIKENDNKSITVFIKGSLDLKSIDNPKRFLSAFKMLYGENVKMEDISFRSEEKYVLSSNFEYRLGEIDHHFEVKDVHFKTDKLNYKYRENE